MHVLAPYVVGYLLTGSGPRGLDGNWQGWARGEGVCFALLVRDGLLECPNCGGDHFTTLRVPQKNLFSSTLAQPGRTGLVLTDLPPFIVTALPTNSLPLPRLYCHCGSLRDAHMQYMCSRLCTNTRMHGERGMQRCAHAHWHSTHSLVCARSPQKPQGALRRLGRLESALMMAPVK